MTTTVTNEKDDESEYDMMGTSGIGAYNDEKRRQYFETEMTVEELYEVRTDIARRIQRVVQQVKQQLVDRD
ncbi:hypothetical protein BGZ65_010231 [Modicella reniformis]|uniref:Uncharacterized protein n=1 Tax=Modicella reniformis TaxID=1440133 RepID=A0A9P6IPI1_9FUNG|nr:hypothetical protein BGZ65_010231 [Modicella reniformis]